MNWRTVGSGREELRVALLVPYLLRLTETPNGWEVERAIVAATGLPEDALEDETRWVSTIAALRALRALRKNLGDEALTSYGPWRMRPQTLGVYAALLREARTPLEAFRYRAAHAGELTRVGNFEFSELGARSVRFIYRPESDLEAPQNDRLLCLARQAELRSLPCFWGLAEAEVTHAKCLDAGDSCCDYTLRWNERSPVAATAIGAGLLAATGGLAGATHSAFASALGAGVGLAIGGALGLTWVRTRSGSTENRTADKLRIAALERSLELRSHLSRAPGELQGSLLAGKYRIRQRIGGGGIGVVYAADNVGVGTPVAIKLLKGAAASDGAEGARLRREARIQMSVDHPNIARTLDLDTLADGSIYIVMELLEGENLASRLRHGGPLGWQDAVRVFGAVCRGLQAVGVVHRDLKPANIYLCSDGRVKILDFGMGKFAGADALTEAGYTLGTPEYMSPEQCIGAHLDGRSDIYSLGVLIYQALTGQLPLRTTNRRELLEMHQQQIPISITKSKPDLKIPPALDELVLRCLAKKADDRPATATELATALESIASGQNTAADPKEPG